MTIFCVKGIIISIRTAVITHTEPSHCVTYKESAPFEESIYIDLREKLSNIFKKIGSKKAKLIAQVKKLKIRIKKR